jgi:integrase
MATGRINDTWLLKDKRTRSKRYGIGKRWQAVWTNDRGDEEKKSFEFKDAAKAWIDNKVTENTLNPRGLKPDMPLSEYWAMWRAGQVHQRASSLRTIDSHGRRRILPSFGTMNMQSIGREEVQAAVNSWAGMVAASTVELTYTYFRTLMSDASLDRRIGESPCRKINLPAKPKKRVVPLSVEQVQMIVDGFVEPYKSAAVFAAASGLRPGEWRGLSVEYVDLEAGTVTVEQQDADSGASSPALGPLKNSYSHRTITVGPATVGLLTKLVENSAPSGRLFHKGGRVITPSHITRIWDALRQDLPWMGKGFHQLRHHHASLLIGGGASPVAVAHRLGHKDANETLATYGHLWKDDDSKMAAMSDGLLKLTGGATATIPPQ